MPPDHLPVEVPSPAREAAGAWLLLPAVLLAAGLVPAASTVVAVALPAVMTDLSMGGAAIGWLVTGYLVVIAALQPVAGRLGDRRGHRAALLAGTALLGAASAGAALAPGPGTLVAARLLQAAAGALIVPNGLALLRHGLPAARRDQAVGAFMAVMATASVVAVAAGGALVAAGGWRAPFLTLAVLAGLAVLPLARLVRNGPEGRAGATGAQDTGPADRRDPAGQGPGASPRGWAARLRPVARPAAGMALTNLALYLVLLVIPLQLEARGWSAGVAGLLLGVFTAAAAAGSLGTARLRERLGASRALRLPAGAAAAGLLAAACAPVALPWLLPALLVAGWGLGTGMSGLLSQGVGDAGSATAGAASGVLASSRYAGSIAGTAALPSMLAAGGHAGALTVGALAALSAAALAGRDVCYS